ncbi:MAG: lipopolysaccharide heptosyltransferase I [Nitrospirota bacterium]
MKILIIKPSSLGDIIHALPFLKAVKDRFPDASVDWAVSKNLLGILEDNPLINELIVFDKDSWKSIKNIPKTSRDISRLRKTLKSRNYDIVVDLQGLLRSGLISLSTPSPLRVGFADAREGSRFMYNKKVAVNGIIHAVDKNLEIAKAIGATAKKAEFPLSVDDKSRRKIKELLGDVKEYILILPSARWPSKRWPPEHFAALISKLKMPCVISGSSADKEICLKIIKNIPETTKQPKIINLCGETSLKELAALIESAKAIVSNDSGPMHIAAALKKPLVALFGPTDPSKTGPYGCQKNKELKVIMTGISCSPCFKKSCKEPLCMTEISAETVFDKLRKYL